MLRIVWAAVAMVVLGGCATPPGQLKDADLSWAEYTVSASLLEVYSGLQNNARHCGGLIDQFDPKWYPSQDMQSAKIDLYLKGAFGGASDWVAGVMDLNNLDGKTFIRAGIQKPYSNPVFGRNGWWRPKLDLIIKEIESGAAPSCG